MYHGPSDEVLERTRDRGAEETQTRVKAGEELFKELSDEEKVKILGKGAFELYRSGEISLKDLVSWRESPKWGRSLEVKIPTPEELQRKRQETSTSSRRGRG